MTFQGNSLERGIPFSESTDMYWFDLFDILHLGHPCKMALNIRNVLQTKEGALFRNVDHHTRLATFVYSVKKGLEWYGSNDRSEVCVTVREKSTFFRLP